MPRLKPTKACEYCQAEIDIHSIARHETLCKDRSPGERDYALRSRTRALARYHQDKRERERAAQPPPQQEEEQSAPGLHRAQPCRYCHEVIAVGHIVRHEALCTRRTPQERLEITRKRAFSRDWNMRHNSNSKTQIAQTETTNGAAAETCRFCHEPINLRHLQRHQALCATKTPQERIEATQARIVSYGVRERSLLRHGRTHAPATNGRRVPLITTNGKRISLTLSADFDVVRDLLVQLAPSLTLDKVEVF